LISKRDSQMRRFCNYFVNLYNQKVINPFLPFLNINDLEEIKNNLRAVNSDCHSKNESNKQLDKTIIIVAPQSITKEINEEASIQIKAL